MKNYYCEQEINTPISSVDMYTWLRGLTDVEYQSFSKDHVAMGHLNGEGFGGMVCVESIGADPRVLHETESLGSAQPADTEWRELETVSGHRLNQCLSVHPSHIRFLLA